VSTPHDLPAVELHPVERRLRTRIAKAVEAGHDYFVLLAHEHPADGHDVGDNPPYVQFAWRNDLRLQIETQGDGYRESPYTDVQHRLLRNLGFHAPFELGEEFCNWVIMREAEGCQPDSVAALFAQTLWFVHGVSFLDRATARQHAMSHWTFEWNPSPHKRDIKAEILKRFGPH